MTRWKLKKVQKNVNLEQNQIKYLEKHFGQDLNFSIISRKIFKLAIALHEHGIIKDFEDDSIEELRAEIAEEYVRRNITGQKAMEYKEIFEDLTENAKSMLPNFKAAPSIIVPLSEFFSRYKYKEMDEKTYFNLKKIITMNNIVDNIELNPKDKFVELRGKYPHSLLWYAKMFATMVSYFNSHWELERIVPKGLHPVEDLRVIRLYFKDGESQEKAIQKLHEIFCDSRFKIEDTDNRGIWRQLNDRYHVILDRDWVNSLLGKEEKIIPYADMLEEFRTDTPFENARLLLKFYEKVHLISDLVVSESKLMFMTIANFVHEMISDSLVHLEVSFNWTESGSKIVVHVDDR